MGASYGPGSRASTEPATGLGPAGFDPSRIPWHLGVTDETYGIRVWVSRVENLRGHFRLIADYLPEDASPWLRNQIASAVAIADGYIRDCSPLCDSDGSGEAGETGTGSTEGDSAGRVSGIAQPSSSSESS